MKYLGRNILKTGSVVAGLLSGFIASSSLAQEIKLVTGNNYAPFTDESLPQGGLASEIVTIAFEKAGYKPVIEFKGWSRAMEETQRGQYFASFPWIKNAEREANFKFSAPVIQMKNFGIFHKSKPISASSVEDLRNLRLCNPFGYAMAHTLAPFVESGSMLVEDPDWEISCLLMMPKDRVDLVVLDLDRLPSQLEQAQMTMSDFGVTDFPVTIQNLSLVVSKQNGGSDSDKVINDFNNAISAMVSSGEVDKIYEKHNVVRR